jgi:hypothetical protein
MSLFGDYADFFAAIATEKIAKPLFTLRIHAVELLRTDACFEGDQALGLSKGFAGIL